VAGRAVLLGVLLSGLLNLSGCSNPGSGGSTGSGAAGAVPDHRKTVEPTQEQLTFETNPCSVVSLESFRAVDSEILAVEESSETSDIDGATEYRCATPFIEKRGVWLSFQRAWALGFRNSISYSGDFVSREIPGVGLEAIIIMDPTPDPGREGWRRINFRTEHYLGTVGSYLPPGSSESQLISFAATIAGRLK
jgi:hypothetical protein